MRKYQSYKPSGVEWLEEIPEHWNISRLKYLGDLYGGLTGKSGVDFNNDENPKNKPYIPYTNIFNNTYISKDHFHYVSIDEGEIQNRVKKYDMFFLMSSETFKDLGKSCILIDDVDELYLNSFCKGYRIKDENIYPLFLNYQILGHLHREMISYEGKGFTRINLRQDKLNDLFVFYPSISEQLQIVQFLDEKTKFIDKLISTKERKIDLLKQQRTSLINQVITKGLNPDVKMKDSGVEWIGKIPEHWKFIPMKFLLKKNKGSIKTGPFGSQLKSDDFIDKGIKVYNQRTVYDEDYEMGEIYISEKKYQTLKEFKVLEGDILLSTRGTIGKCSIVPLGVDLGVLHPCLIRIQIIEEIVLKKFIWWYINHSTLFIESVRINSNSTTIDVIYSDTIKNHDFPLPPIKEQQQIVEYLDTRTKEIDDLVSMEQKKIDLLKEYRQSMISEVITGKIDVRTNLN